MTNRKRIPITEMKGESWESRTYTSREFVTKREKPLEKNVDVTYMTYSWVFTDTNLGSELTVYLVEQVDFRTMRAKALAIANWPIGKLEENKVRDYVMSQLEEISKDGMAFPKSK